GRSGQCGRRAHRGQHPALRPSLDGNAEMSRALPGALAALVAVAAAAAVPTARAATHGRSFFVYAKPTRVQFVNHADDRARGLKSNPFNADIVLPPPPKANAGKKGGRAGDNAIFAFQLYSRP